MKKPIDIWAIISLIGLCLFGAFNMYGIRPDLFGNFLLFLLFGWLLFFGARLVNYDLLKQNSKGIYFLFVGLLVITLFFQSDIRGARRWIDLYLFQFQTSEFFKPFFLVIIAHLLSYEKKFEYNRLLILFGSAVLPLILIFQQPDLGMVVQYVSVLVVILYFAGTSTRLIAYIVSVIAMFMPILWTFLRDYQKARVIGFLNPEIDPQGITYNITQSIITIGSGGFFGKGLGLGTQARYRFLPEYQTDFAFASLVEQFGFLGGAFVLILYSIVIYRLVRKLFDKNITLFKYLFIVGTITFISLSIFVNIGMNLGLMPVTGIALPFISYGGSSIVSTLLLLGFAFSL